MTKNKDHVYMNFIGDTQTWELIPKYPSQAIYELVTTGKAVTCPLKEGVRDVLEKSNIAGDDLQELCKKLNIKLICEVPQRKLEHLIISQDPDDFKDAKTIFKIPTDNLDTQNWNYRQWQDIHIYVLDKEPSNDVLTKLKTLHVLEKNPTSLRHKGKYKIVVISNKKDANELFQKGEIGIFTHTPCQKSSYARIR